jgi:endoglucanase
MILRQLSDAFGVSGNEDDVRAVVLDAVRDHVDEIKVDALGNVLAVKRGTGRQRLRVMLDAHMDEIGLMVVGYDIDGRGFLKVRSVGGIDPRLLPGTLLQVGPGRIPGVIGIKPIHLFEEKDKRVLKTKELIVDIGARGKDDAEKLAPLGTYATFATRFRELGPTVSGKAFDDRAGCAVLVELLQGERFSFDLHAAFTVQEEVGLRGARVAAYAIEPDCAFALEGTIADDIPKDKKDVSPTTELGKGPAITVMDRSFIADRRLVRLLTGTAEELDIPYQIKQPGIGGTDAGAIHQTREGVPSVAVAVPCRYIHSPVGLLSLDDFNNTVRLMRESLSRLTRRTLN